MKINWDLTKEQFPSTTKDVLICNNCGWLIQNTREIDKDCGNCQMPFSQSNSKPIVLKRG
jgi:hypothetical protein